MTPWTWKPVFSPCNSSFYDTFLCTETSKKKQNNNLKSASVIPTFTHASPSLKKRKSKHPYMSVFFLSLCKYPNEKKRRKAVENTGLGLNFGCISGKSPGECIPGTSARVIGSSARGIHRPGSSALRMHSGKIWSVSPGHRPAECMSGTILHVWVKQNSRNGVLRHAFLPNGTNVCFDILFGPHLPLAFQFVCGPGEGGSGRFPFIWLRRGRHSRNALQIVVFVGGPLFKTFVPLGTHS